MSHTKNIPSRIGNFLSDQGSVGHLAQMLAQQQSLLDKIRRILPDPVNRHCLHARIDRQQLILFTDSPVWNARLRFLAPLLIRELKPLAAHIRTVQIKIQPQTTPARPPSKRLSLTVKAATSILAAASDIDNPQLRNALERLSQHGLQVGFQPGNETESAYSGSE